MLTDFLIAVGTLCAITTVLAILVVVADATIANYGDVKITVNNDRELIVSGGKTLLSTLKEEQLFIPSACGGRGSCGLCKIKILEGAGSPLATELPWLNKEEISGQIRLSCQVKVKNDIRIVVPDELFSVKQYRTRVVAIRDLTYDIKEIRLKLLDPQEIVFKAGQYIQFEVPQYELSSEPVYRAYSISSDPATRDEIEIEVRYVPNGICTTYIHQHLKIGEQIQTNGPYGDFRLRDNDRSIIFIAGGSGMAPIKAILAEMVRNNSRRPARYFFGARAKRDLFLTDEMRVLEGKLPRFAFIPALSSPLPEDEWSGEKGLITEVVDRHVASVADTEAYLCGSPLMIDACVKVLRAKGMPEELIFFDKFA